MFRKITSKSIVEKAFQLYRERTQVLKSIDKELASIAEYQKRRQELGLLSE